MTVRCGIVLHPAGHTLSPVLHAEAYRQAGLDASFEVWDVAPARFEAKVRALLDSGVRQVAVSLPHKESAIALADRVSDAVRAIGAANTLTADAEGVHAENTDWIGVRKTLEPLGPWQGRRAVVVGAGGESGGTLNPYAIYVLSAVAGFSERMVPNVLERISNQAGGKPDNADKDGKTGKDK